MVRGLIAPGSPQPAWAGDGGAGAGQRCERREPAGARGGRANAGHCAAVAIGSGRVFRSRRRATVELTRKEKVYGRKKRE
jgi:hypothetical protein